jgi:hypothetical protein
MQGGPVDELLGVAVERPALDQLEVEVGPAGEDRVLPGLAADHRKTRYAHLRAFTPGVLAALTFNGGPESASLLKAVEILKDLNASGRRRVPDDAPDDFVPARWRDYLTPAEDGHDSAHRRYWAWDS